MSGCTARRLLVRVWCCRGGRRGIGGVTSTEWKARGGCGRRLGGIIATATQGPGGVLRDHPEQPWPRPAAVTAISAAIEPAGGPAAADLGKRPHGQGPSGRIHVCHRPRATQDPKRKTMLPYHGQLVQAGAQTQAGCTLEHQPNSARPGSRVRRVRDVRGGRRIHFNRSGAGTAPAPHGNRRTTVRKYQNALEGAPPGLWCRPPKEHN